MPSEPGFCLSDGCLGPSTWAPGSGRASRQDCGGSSLTSAQVQVQRERAPRGRAPSNRHCGMRCGALIGSAPGHVTCPAHSPPWGGFSGWTEPPDTGRGMSSVQPNDKTNVHRCPTGDRSPCSAVEWARGDDARTVLRATPGPRQVPSERELLLLLFAKHSSRLLSAPYLLVLKTAQDGALPSPFYSGEIKPQRSYAT